MTTDKQLLVMCYKCGRMVPLDQTMLEFVSDPASDLDPPDRLDVAECLECRQSADPEKAALRTANARKLRGLSS